MFECLEHIDRLFFLAINGFNSPVFDIIFWNISKGIIFYPLFLIIAWVIYKAKGMKYLASMFVCLGFLILISDQTCNLVKNSVKRFRPSHNVEIQEQVHTVNEYKGGTFGFFSAHAANTFGVTSFLLLCLKWIQTKKKYFLLLWPLLVGYSRIYLGVHYPADILFGALNGIFWSFLIYALFKLLIKKLNAEVH